MKKLIRVILLIFIFFGLAVAFSYPLILNFNNTLPYTHIPAKGFELTYMMQGDHISLYYIYWLIKDYFVTPGQHLFYEPYMFTVTDMPRPFEPRGLPSSILFLIFSIFGNITAYNCVVFLSFILAGTSTFCLAKKYLQNTPSAIISGIIFTISPFRISHLFGAHPTGFILFWIPFIIFLYEKLWETKKQIYGWVAAFSIFLMCMEEHHMGYYSALFTIIFWAYKFFLIEKKNIKCFLNFIFTLPPIFTGWILSASYMFYIKSVVISSSIAGKGRTLDEIKLYAPRIKDIFTRTNPDSEKYIYIGIFTAILLLIGLSKKIINIKQKENYFPYIFYFFTFITTLLLSLGPNLPGIPLYKICYKIIPFFYFPRSPARLYMYTLIALSLLSGYGAKMVFESFKKQYLKYLFSFIIIICICADFYTSHIIGLTKMAQKNNTYDYIQKSFLKNPVLEIPIWPGESSWTSIYQYYTTIYRIPLVNGYSPFVAQKYQDEIFWPLASVNMGMLNKEQYDLLKKLKVKFINLHEEAYPQKVSPFPFKVTLENFMRSPFLKFIIQDGPIYLFEVLDMPSQKPLNIYTVPSKTGILYECEYMPHRIGQPVKDKLASASMSLYAKGLQQEPAHLCFGPWQLFPPGKYQILLRAKLGKLTNKTKIASFEVSTEKGNKILSSIDLFSDETSEQYKDYIIDFTLDELKVLEFRTIYYGNSPIWLDYIYLICKEKDDPEMFFYAKDLFHIGREIDGVIYASPQIDPPGNLIFGPYRRYPEGKYRVNFKLKAGELTEYIGAILKVKSVYAETYIAYKHLQYIPSEYTNYSIDIPLEKPTVLEFQVEFTKKVPIYVDSIKIDNISS